MLFFNVRSMLEIDNTVVKYYFEVMQASLRENGLFASINRYAKKVITQVNDIEVKRLADYPFDDY